MTVIMRCWGPQWAPKELQADGDYIKSYDPDAHDGKGEVVFTRNLAEAVTFTTKQEALEFYRKVSTVQPVRDDGKPNRPLSAFSVEITEDTEHVTRH